MLSDVRLSVAYIGPTACCYYYYGRCEFLSLSLYLLEEPPPIITRCKTLVSITQKIETFTRFSPNFLTIFHFKRKFREVFPVTGDTYKSA